MNRGGGEGGYEPCCRGEIILLKLANEMFDKFHLSPSDRIVMRCSGYVWTALSMLGLFQADGGGSAVLTSGSDFAWECEETASVKGGGNSNGRTYAGTKEATTTPLHSICANREQPPPPSLRANV